jgi:hypothetical protein
MLKKNWPQIDADECGLTTKKLSPFICVYQRLKLVAGLPPTVAAAARALGLGTGFVYIERPSIKIFAVQCRDRLVALTVVRHLDKPKTSGLSRITIRANVHTRNGSMSLKEGSNCIFGRPKTEVSDIDILHRIFL